MALQLQRDVCPTCRQELPNTERTHILVDRTPARISLADVKNEIDSCYDKIEAIKCVREHYDIGLKDAKEIVEYIGYPR